MDTSSNWGGSRPNSGPKRKYISVKLPLPEYASVEEAARLAGYDSGQDYIRSHILMAARDTIARETGEPLCSVCKKWYCGFHYEKVHNDDEESFEQQKQ